MISSNVYGKQPSNRWELKEGTAQVVEAQQSVESEEKTLDVVSVDDLKEKVSDVVVVGNGNMFQLLCKASSKSQGWMKSTKACEIEGLGCIVQVTTQQGDNVAEALTFVPGAKIVDDENGGRKLNPESRADAVVAERFFGVGGAPVDQVTAAFGSDSGVEGEGRGW